MKDQVVVPLNMVIHVASYLYSLFHQEIYTSQDGLTIVGSHYNKEDSVTRNVECKLKPLEGTELFIIDSVTELPNEDEVVCDNCGKIVSVDSLSDNELITSGNTINICEECVINGYGE